MSATTLFDQAAYVQRERQAAYADYDAWCLKHMVAWNRLAVADPAEWERIACRVDALLERLRWRP